MPKFAKWLQEWKDNLVKRIEYLHLKKLRKYTKGMRSKKITRKTTFQYQNQGEKYEEYMHYGKTKHFSIPKYTALLDRIQESQIFKNA